MPTRQGALTTKSTCPGDSPLLYNGGPIQPAPKAYLVFWGDWSTKNDPNNVESLLTQFYGAMFGSLWLETAAQYTQSDGQHVGNNPFSVPVWNDAVAVPAVPTDSDLGNEAARAVAHFGDKSTSAVYVLAIQHGSKPDGFGSSYCAWHSTQGVGTSTVAFINLPYLPDATSGCGANSVRDADDGVTIVAGHEQAETETDPQPTTGWTDASGEEIGDKCAWLNLQLLSFGAQQFATQPLWSNAAGGCIQ